MPLTRACFVPRVQAAEITEALRIEVPRDREGSFEPLLIPKR